MNKRKRQRFEAEDVTEVLYEAGLHIKERTSSWHKSYKESPMREDDLLTQAEESSSQTKVDKGTKVKLQESSDAWVDICNDMDVSRKKSLQKKELMQCFDRHNATWKPTASKTEATPENA